MSLESASNNTNPLGGAQALEARFENLWQSGAFDSQDPGEAAQLQAERQRQTGRQPAQQTQQRQPQPQQQAQPRQAQQQQPPQDDAHQVDQPVEEETQQVEQQTQPEEQGPDYQDLDDYLSQSQVDRESFYSLPVTVKVDGKTSQVPLQDLVRSYQMDAHVTQRSQAATAEQQKWEGERDQAKQVLVQSLQNAQALLNIGQRELLREYQNLEQLKATNPYEWSIKNQELTQRIGQIQNFLAQVNQAQVQQQQQAQQELMQRLPQEWDRTVQQIPAWSDPNKFSADQQNMLSMGQKLGFSPAELAQIHDHRYMVALHYASQYLKNLQAQPLALKKVRAAPQMAAPGTRVSRDPQQVQRQSAKKAFKQNPKSLDAQVAYFNTLA